MEHSRFCEAKLVKKYVSDSAGQQEWFVGASFIYLVPSVLSVLVK
jgi:hypothetical protein